MFSSLDLLNPGFRNLVQLKFRSGWKLLLQLCDHTTSPMCSQRGRNEFSPYKNGSCSITQFFSWPKVSKSYCVISQEPFLYSVRTLSAEMQLLWKQFCEQGVLIFCSIFSRQNILRDVIDAFESSRFFSDQAVQCWEDAQWYFESLWHRFTAETQSAMNRMRRNPVSWNEQNETQE